MNRRIAAFGRRAAVMRNDELTALEEHVGHGDRFVEQTAGVAPQVNDQAVKIGRVEVPQEAFVAALRLDD